MSVTGHKMAIICNKLAFSRRGYVWYILNLTSFVSGGKCHLTIGLIALAKDSSSVVVMVLDTGHY